MPVNRPFTTEPNTRYHMPNSTPMRKRAACLMELLFQNGFIKEAPYETIHQFVVEKADFIGLDQRTVTQYIGRPRKTLRPGENPKTEVTISYRSTGSVIQKGYSAVRRLPEKLGICQKLGYLRLEYRNEVAFLIFNHRNVPLPYHANEALFDSEQSEVLECSKDDLCVSPIGSKNKNTEAGRESVVIESRESRVSKQHTQIAPKNESESIRLTPREKLVLKACRERGEGPMTRRKGVTGGVVTK